MVGESFFVFHYTGDPTPLSFSTPCFSSFSCSLSLFFLSLPQVSLFSFTIFFSFLLFPSLSLSLSQIQSKIFSAPGMSLRAYFSTEFSCGDVFDREESEVSVIDESREPRHKGGMDLHHHAIEFDIEFWPVEHPMEPQDEDRPVKCPMPASSSINDGIGNEERLAAESSRKRSEVTEKLKKGTPVGTEPAVRAVRKRHHTLTRDDHVIKPLVRMPPLPPLPTQNLTIFQMLQEFDKFNS